MRAQKYTRFKNVNFFHIATAKEEKYTHRKAVNESSLVIEPIYYYVTKFIMFAKQKITF